MLQRFTTGVVVLLVLTFVTSGFAQDVKKDAKAVVVNSVSKQAPANQAKQSSKAQTFKFVACSQQGCGFWAKSHSKKELVNVIKKHSKRHHKIVLTDKQAQDMVKVEGGK